MGCLYKLVRILEVEKENQKITVLLRKGNKKQCIEVDIKVFWKQIGAGGCFECPLNIICKNNTNAFLCGNKDLQNIILNLANKEEFVKKPKTHLMFPVSFKKSKLRF